MAKKTYAAVMKQLSSKKASYEKGLEEARRTGNRAGIADYERRLTKLSAGMDELFAQQQMANGNNGLGSSAMPKAFGGLDTADGGGAGGGVQNLPPGYRHLDSFQSYTVPANTHRVPGAFVDENGNYQIIAMPDGTHRYVTPNMAADIAKGSGVFAHNMEFGKYDTPDDYIGYEGSAGAQPVATPTGRTDFSTGEPKPTPEVAPTPTPDPGVGGTGTGTSTPSRDVTPVATIDPLETQQVLNTAKGDMYYGDAYGLKTPLGTMKDLPTDPTIPTKTTRMREFRDQIAGNAAPIGMAIGAAAQFIPDLMAKRRMKQLEGPADMPMLGVQTMNTDIQTGKALENIRQSEARALASVDANFANPAVAAAMKRTAQRSADAQAGNVLFQEAQQETALRNQNLRQIQDTLNKNKQIGFQNQQRQIDFENQRLAGLNKMDMQMGQKLGQVFGDFQNRAQDMKKWELYSKVFDADMAKRQGLTKDDLFS